MSRRSVLRQSAAGVACAVSAANVLFSILSLFRSTPLLEAIATNDLPVSAEIAGILLFQCAIGHTVGFLVMSGTKGKSWATSLLQVALLSLVSTWVALFNIQVFLAPSFTFTVGPVVMANPYIAVVLTYLACALISFGFIFLNARLAHAGEDDHSAEREGGSVEKFSMIASGVQGLFFVALGILAGV
ncbi:hypothetical protein [Salinibacter altiplanensis]|uniref:hypothetical protein n=1 Tax=Salinibacter altiplanensis TaxID=1803181 RepID=UPI001E2BF9E2|nr:hypothetical protein [Salinibacter altiplanensis]